MDNVWESRLFASLPELLDEVNARGLAADRFKVVPEASASGYGRYHLLYLTGADPDPLVAAVAVAGTDDVIPELLEEERAEVLDEAEAIIREGQHPDRD
jgi:hypothetical protein